MKNMSRDEFIPQLRPTKDNSAPGPKKDNTKSGPLREKGLLSIPKFLQKDNQEQKGAATSSKTAIDLKNQKRRKVLKILGTTLLVIFVVSSLLVFNVYLKARKLIADSKSLKSAFTAQDLPLLKKELGQTQNSLKALRSSYKFIVWMKYVPFFGSYVSDGNHLINAGITGLEVADISINTVEPYADLLGFSAEEQTGDGEKTAADRIDFLVKALPEITPKIDEVSQKMKVVDSEVEKVDPSRYPNKLAGKEVRSNLEALIELVRTSTDFVVNGKPLIEQAPYLLGMDSPRTYLVLFQNDKELRPTGGFMTAYSIMKVDKAKFEPVSSNDIYNLDAKYTPRIKAPDPIIKYIKGPYILSKNIRLRDMNWSPDFYESMKLFTDEAERVGVSDIDGIIAVDTQVLVNLLNVTGPIGVSGFGNFSTEIVPECNCPQVIHELESFADVEGPIVWDPVSGEIVYRPPNSDNRKRIIGPLMNAILSNSLGQPKEKLPALFGATYKSLVEKHVLFYLFDEGAQAAVESFNIAGRVQDFEGDYLYINDANLGGRKSNLYVTQEVSQEYELLKDGSIEKTVVITYKNPEKHDGWLNSVLPNWVRIYVPKGSELITFEGVEDKQDTYEEFGRDVFAGYFELRPQGVSKVTLKYKLPFKLDDLNEGNNLLIQKQPGTDAPLYSIHFGKQEEEFYLKTDREIRLRI
jgi:hypothetical protein